MNQAYERARTLLSERRRGLDHLAQTLEEVETLEGEILEQALTDAQILDRDRPGDTASDEGDGSLVA